MEKYKEGEIRKGGRKMDAETGRWSGLMERQGGRAEEQNGGIILHV